MKKLITICAVATMVLAVGTANTQASVHVGTWNDVHSASQTWYESMDGGGPGQAGNQFFTDAGSSFWMGGATLSQVEIITDPTYNYKTTYIGGGMMLYGGGWGPEPMYMVNFGDIIVYSTGADDWDPTFGHLGQISWMMEGSGSIDGQPEYIVNFTATNGVLSGYLPAEYGYSVGHTGTNGEIPVMTGDFDTTQVTITAIPEPASIIVWGLLGAGCAGGAMACRRRRRAPWSEETRQNIHQIIDQGRTNA